MTRADVDRAFRSSARLAAGDPRFVPVFERMERIKARHDAQDGAIARARAALEAV